MSISFFALKNPIKPPEAQQTFQQDLNVHLYCTDCHVPGQPPNLIEEYSSGDLICGDCGKVLGDRIVDTRSEWRTFANEEGDDPSRVGGPSNPLGLDDGTLETTISFKDNHSGVSAELRRASARANTKSGDKSLFEGYNLIMTMCEVISLPRTISDIAKQLYKRVEEEKLLRGKAHDAVIAACIFIACRQAQVPRTFKEIVALTKVPKKQIGQCFKALEAAFETGGALDASSPENLVPRMCNHLSLKPPAPGAAEILVRKTVERGILAGRSPISIVGACIYFIAALFGQTRSLKEISNAVGVSDGTIRTSYKLLYPHRHDIIEQSWLTNGRDVDRLPTH